MNSDRAERLRLRAARQYGLTAAAQPPTHQAIDPSAAHSSESTGVQTLAEPQTLVDGFAAMAARHADRTALRCQGRRMTYGELDAASTALAGAIQAQTSTLDRPVAILLERSAEVVVTALAVLKTGSSYVPLDPATPAARIALIADDTNPTLAITSPALSGMLPRGVPVLVADQSTTAIAAGPALPEVGPATRAYIVFTSGTTGRPKGVEVTHGNVMRLFTTTESLFGFGCDDVWSFFHSFGFDFSVWEIWGALLYGGCVVVVPSAVEKDPVKFRQLLRDQQVTMLNQTPTAFNQLIAEDIRHRDRLPVRRVMFSGEALHFRDLKPWVDKYGDASPELINMYGITETTVHATYRRVRKADLNRRTSLIGYPLPDLKFLLIDKNLTPVPQGELGEIVVIGPGVTSGYLKQPELTAERFIDLTDTTGKMVRGYRSGDLARITPTGEFEYHGRRDDQVKIRGFRIELGEVENALRALDGVTHAVVVVRELPGLGASLVAYVVPGESGDAASPSVVRQQLKLILPEYMIPSVVMTLESLPRTHHGKIDRKTLPHPDSDSGSVPADDPAGEAKDDTEAAILTILARLLPSSTVHPTATFFDLGGHSLLATQLLAEVRDAYGVDVGLQEFFRYPTARTLAGIVGEHQATASPNDRHRSPGLFTLRRKSGNTTPMFALPGALGFASAFAQISAHITARSCYALETRSMLSESDEQPALDALIEDCARTIAEAAGGRAIHLVGHSFGGRLGIHLVGPLHSRGTRVASLALLDPPAPAAHAREPARDRKEKLRAFLGHMVHFFPPTVGQQAGELLDGVEPVPEKIIFAEAQRLMDPAGAALLGDSLEAEFERYLRTTCVVWPEPDPIDCPVLLLTAADSRSELADDPAENWARYLPASLLHREIAASHDGMLRHPHAQPLAIELAQFFARYDTEATSAAPSEKRPRRDVPR